jgi:hypothetical protein
LVARGLPFAFLTVAALAACVGEDPDTTAASQGPDGGSSSSGVISGNLVEDSSFENGCSGITSNGELTSDSSQGLARTGAKACKVCRTPGGEPTLYVYARVDVTPKVDEVYDVSAWMRKVPGVEGGREDKISINGIDSGGSANDDGFLANGPESISDEWKFASLTWTVRKDADRARVDLGLPAAADNVCFLVDDLTVKRK